MSKTRKRMKRKGSQIIERLEPRVTKILKANSYRKLQRMARKEPSIKGNIGKKKIVQKLLAKGYFPTPTPALTTKTPSKSNNKKKITKPDDEYQTPRKKLEIQFDIATKTTDNNQFSAFDSEEGEPTATTQAQRTNTTFVTPQLQLQQSQKTQHQLEQKIVKLEEELKAFRKNQIYLTKVVNALSNRENQRKMRGSKSYSQKHQLQHKHQQGQNSDQIHHENWRYRCQVNENKWCNNCLSADPDHTYSHCKLPSTYLRTNAQKLWRKIASIVKKEKLGVSMTKKEVLKILTHKYKSLLVQVVDQERTHVTEDFYKSYEKSFFEKFVLNEDLLKDLFSKKEEGKDFLTWFKQKLNHAATYKKRTMEAKEKETVNKTKRMSPLIKKIGTEMRKQVGIE